MARRSQAQRSAETRARVLAAAVACLRQDGYAATTTIRVAQDAGLSRGAMLHQFPTREDLLLFVVREVYEQELKLYAQLMAEIADPRERLRSLPQVVWDVLSRPSGVAVLEIFQGARSDASLAERLRVLQVRIEADSFARTARLASEVGAPAPPELIRLIVWAVRGLSIAQTLSDTPADVAASLALLRDLIDNHLAQANDGRRQPAD